MNDYFINNPDAVDQYRQRFMDTMAFVHRVFPFGFRGSKTGKVTRRARFEAIALGSFLALRERPELAADQVQVTDWLASPEFASVTGSDGANAIARLRRRINFVRDRLIAANHTENS